MNITAMMDLPTTMDEAAFNDSVISQWMGLSINQSTDQLNSSTADCFYCEWPSMVVGAVLSVIVLLTIGGNLLILAAVLFNSNLRGPTHILIANLAVADLLLGFLVLPFSATLEVTGKWYFGSIFCDVWAAVDVLCCTASIISLCCISVDRYIGITRPLNYYSIVTARRSTVLCFFVWVSSLFISIGPLLGWKERPILPAENTYTCTVTTETGYVLFSAIGSFYLPTLVILAVYWRIYRAAVKQTKFLESGTKTEKSSLSEVTLRVHVGRSTTSTSANHNVNHQLVKGRTGGSSLEPPSNRLAGGRNASDTGNMSKIGANRTPRGSDAEANNGSQQKPAEAATTGLSAKLFKFRRQKKAAKTLGIVVGAFLLCWFPFFVILPIEALCGDSCNIPKPLFSFCFWLGYCNSCLNPFIYAATSREFKRAFFKILCGRKRAHAASNQRLTAVAAASPATHRDRCGP